MVLSAVRIILSEAEHAELQVVARARTTAVRCAQRAWIVLAAAERLSNAQIARDLGVHVDTVRTWRGRFAAAGIKGLIDRPGSGRPPVFPAMVRAGVKVVACSLPAEQGVPTSRWSCRDLAVEAVSRGITSAVSESTVRRWLSTDALKPWQYRSWISPRDPDFAVKGARVLELYDRWWEGQVLGPDD